MAFNISGAAIRQPITSAVLFTVLMVLGLVSFSRIPITRAPNIDVPVVSVTILQAGAAPSELELQVTRKIEDAVANVTGVKHILSSVTDGTSVTTIELRLEIGADRALNDVKDAVARIRAELPRTIEEPVVERIDVVGQSILTYAAATTGMTPEQLSWFVDDVVLRELRGVRGVGRVERIGGVTREIRVALDPDRLAALGITAGDVNRQLRATSVDLAGGRAELGGREQAIRTLAGAESLDTLAATRIALPGGRDVRLADLAEITDSYEEPRSFARVDGDIPVVSFAIFRAKGASDVVVADLVQQRVDALAARHPGVSYRLIDESVGQSRGSYLSAMHSLIEGAVLAVLVVLVFLRDWRATLLAAVALPLSIIPAFWAMELMGFSFNFVSLLAITLVTGILVDDAIVEIENIVRHIRMGKRPYEAAIEAADEIGLAVMAITCTIVAVFAPVSFMGGIPGQYFKQFGLTVDAAVIVSLGVARLVTPVMAAYMLRPHPAREAREGWVMRTYLRLLHRTLAHPYLTMAGGIGLFALSLWSTTLLPTGFIPPEDQSRVVLSLELPPGARLDDTADKTDAVARGFREIPEVTSVFTIGGTTPTGQGREIRKAAMVVRLKPKDQRPRSQKQIEAELASRLAAIPDIRGWYVNDRGERELSVIVLGNDAVDLDRVVAKLEGAVRRLPGFANVAANAGAERPEIRIAPRLDEAARAGVTTEAIAEAVRIGTIGDIAANLAKFRDRDRLIPIRVQLRETARRDLQALDTLTVSGGSGTGGTAPLPLLSVADIGFGQGPSSIERFDRERRVVPGRRSVARHCARRGAGAGLRAAGGAASARHGAHQEQRRRGDHGGGVLRVHAGGRRRADDCAGGAGAAVRWCVPADHHSALPTAIDRRRDRRAAVDRPADQPARGDRDLDADRHRDQERDHAGGFRDRGARPRHRSARGDRRCRPQARASDRDDHARHGRRHVAERARRRRRRRVPRPHGDGRDRRAGRLDLAVAGVRAEFLHRDGRPILAGARRLAPTPARAARCGGGPSGVAGVGWHPSAGTRVHGNLTPRKIPRPVRRAPRPHPGCRRRPGAGCSTSPRRPTPKRSPAASRCSPSRGRDSGASRGHDDAPGPRREPPVAPCRRRRARSACARHSCERLPPSA
jgi:hydrophobic/amphiphilic exporter-1 (mainly G- bacteria), HAE1 family